MSGHRNVFGEDKRLLASIRLNEQVYPNCYSCGCEFRADKWWLCQYHTGYRDALEVESPEAK